MKISLLLLIVIILLPCCKNAETGTQTASVSTPKWALAVHGGAGVITREKMTARMDSEYRASLKTALDSGKAMLAGGASALDAVECVVRILEDNPLFNAGKGAVFNHDGVNELDAAIMDGATLSAGAVTCVTDIRNPITAARRVMTNSEHVLLSGKGASDFAREQGLEIVDPSYFYTERRYNELSEALKREKSGTVGCCALDLKGNLAAATSTGGRTNKRWNRVGDTPIIGAGTYANNATCAVSGTGHGEYFIRWTVAHDISALIEYKGLSLEAAADEVINKKLVKAGGSGGIIAVGKDGSVAMPFNSEGMFRGYASSDGGYGIFIYRDEK